MFEIQIQRTYVCVSIAALGEPVVPAEYVSIHSGIYSLVCHLPEVNCKLTTSSRATFLSAHSNVAVFINTGRPFEVNVS